MALPDVQQKNVTAAEAAAAHALDPLTGQFLEPVDGKGMCADNFSTGKSPVNLALTQLKRLGAGLRGALLGDFPGAVQKSVKSLYINLTGGTTHTQAPGTVRITGTGVRANDVLLVDVGTITTLDGNVKTNTGNLIGLDPESYVQLGLQASGERSFHTTRRIVFNGVTTGGTGSNPPQGTTGLANSLLAANIPKAYCCVRMSAPSVVDSFEGFGVASVTVASHVLVFTFASNFVDANFTLVCGTIVTTSAGKIALPDDYLGYRTANSAGIGFRTPVGVAINLDTEYIDYFQVAFFGKQTT